MMVSSSIWSTLAGKFDEWVEVDEGEFEFEPVDEGEEDEQIIDFDNR
jgi:hypothetical protein